MKPLFLQPRKTMETKKYTLKKGTKNTNFIKILPF